MFIHILLLVLLIFINGVFSSSEIAFLSLNKVKLNRMIKDNNKKAVKVKKLIDNPSSFLATIQIGITLAGFLASAFAADTFADQIVANLVIGNISKEVLKPIVVIIVTIILSYFTLVFGELVPKRIGMNGPEKIAFAVVDMITVLMKIAYPFVFLLTKSTNLIVKLFKIKDKGEEKITEEEIKLIIAEGKDSGAIEDNEKELIYNIFNFNDITVSKIMTPREHVVAIDNSMSSKAIMDIIRESKYTRLPVYDKKLDNIIGIFNVKDIIHKYKRGEQIKIKEIVNNAMFVNENEFVDDVFRLMQKNRQEMAIVLNDDKKLSGVVTTEDAIEEIVGNIFDEYDE